MSDHTPEIEEAREIIKVRRISTKPTPPAEKKDDEAEAAKARQAELEKRLRRLRFFLGVAILAFLPLGLRSLGCVPSQRAPLATTPCQTASSATALPTPQSPLSPQQNVASPKFRRIFTSDPNRAKSAAAFSTSDENAASAFESPAAFSATLDDLRVIRIAAWNLEPFDFSKVNNSTIGERIAQILQEFDVVALQGVRSKNRAVLEALVYLTSRQGGNYDYVVSTPTPRDSIAAFFFNTQTIVVDRESVSDVFDARGRLRAPALVANFRPNNVAPESCFTFQIINIRLFGDSTDGEALVDLLATLKKRAGGFGLAEDDLIVAGDFGVAIQKIKGVDKIVDVATLHRDQITDTQGGASVNFLFNSLATSEYAERFGVVNLAEYFGISDAEAEKIARGRPVWGDFSVYEGGDPHFFAPTERK
ncbi:MAG: hypothetical protein IJE97_12675 [Thermoguttaceae bacterium]|nr:hypothetical protein [Thermoguttaceae bacterium]